MYYDRTVRDDEDDPDGNHRHIVATGLVTTQEVEDVIAGHQGPWAASRSSGARAILARACGDGTLFFESPILASLQIGKVTWISTTSQEGQVPGI
jgi:hypothetical protein